MKVQTSILAALLAGALAFSGCGKSEADKKMESELNEKIMQAHEGQMAMASQIDELLASISTAMAQHDSLAKVFPKDMADKSDANLITAKDKLSAAKDAMESWMSSHEPYNESVKHALAMEQLNKDMDEVTQVGQEMSGAITSAKAALDEYGNAVAVVLAKGQKGKRK
jgi:truncated hemoglobin YjbI